MVLLVVIENNVCLNLETTHCFGVVQEQKSALRLVLGNGSYGFKILNTIEGKVLKTFLFKDSK